MIRFKNWEIMSFSGGGDTPQKQGNSILLVFFYFTGQFKRISTAIMIYPTALQGLLELL